MGQHHHPGRSVSPARTRHPNGYRRNAGGHSRHTFAAVGGMDSSAFLLRTHLRRHRYRLSFYAGMCAIVHRQARQNHYGRPINQDLYETYRLFNQNIKLMNALKLLKYVSAGACWVLLLLAFANLSHAQQVGVSGTVRDLEGNALAGVTVSQKGVG